MIQLASYKQKHRLLRYSSIVFFLAGLSASPLIAEDTTDSAQATPASDASPAASAPPPTYVAPSAPPATLPGSNGAPAPPSGNYSTPTFSSPPASRLPLRFTVGISEVYDDNIFIRPHKTSDFITQVNLSAAYRVGDRKVSDGNFFTLSYAPSFDAYANHSSQDSFNQSVDAFYQHRFTKLTLSLDQAFTKENSSNAAAGNLVRTNTYTTTAVANYLYSDRLSLVETASQNVTDNESSGFSSSIEWNGDAYVLYKLDSKISIGIGPRFGFLDIESAPNQTYEQLLGHAIYKYSKKLTFSLAGGAEYRQYQVGASDTVEPVFTLAGTYDPFPHTSLTLASSRSYLPSYNQHGQDYVATTISLSGTQRFLQKYYYNLGFGYENDGYQTAGAVINGPSRDDDYFYATTGLGWSPTTWLSTSIFYKYQKDDSNARGFSFTDNQAGLSVSATY